MSFVDLNKIRYKYSTSVKIIKKFTNFKIQVLQEVHTNILLFQDIKKIALKYTRIQCPYKIF